MINKVILIGNLGRDPEVRRLESGAVVAAFSVATNENYKDKSDQWQTVTEWHNIVCWRGLAERAEQYLKKGMMVYVEGKLTHRKWQDKEGNDRYTTEVVANTWRLLEKREASTKQGSSNMPTSEPVANTATTSAPAVETPAAEDDDLPF